MVGRQSPAVTGLNASLGVVFRRSWTLSRPLVQVVKNNVCRRKESEVCFAVPSLGQVLFV